MTTVLPDQLAPDHLAQHQLTLDQLVLGGDWTLSPHVITRGAGFPADGVLRLRAAELAAHADELADADQDDPRWAEFRARFDTAARAAGRELQRIAVDDDFRRAVALQNHRLVDSALAPLLRWDADTDPRLAKHRDREGLVASYWQRYCVKNDSIGFFGPVLWSVADGAASTRLRPGTRLTRSMEVFFEPWAIDRLAEVVHELPGMRMWVPPRRNAFVRLDGDLVTPPVGKPVRLTEFEASVLRSCDGRTRARDLGEDAVAVLESFVKRRWVTWKLDVPLSKWPMRELRGFVEGVSDDAVRVPALRMLDRLDAGRADLQLKVHAPAEELTAALLALDATFTELTAGPSTRNAGQAYGGRTLVYCDSRRDADLTLGTTVLAAAEPVRLLADSGRWFCAEVAKGIRPVLNDVYAALAAQRPVVDFAAFWMKSLMPLRTAINTATSAVQQEFWRRWASILDLPEGRRVRYGFTELLPKVRAAFAAEGPGWSAARHFSPDLMVAARDTAAIDRGEFQLVLGEVHMAINAQRSNCLVSQHPDLSVLHAQTDVEFPAPRLLPVLPKGSLPRLSIRTHPGFVRDKDFLLETTHHTVPADRPGLVKAGDVEVRPEGDSLVLRLPTGETFDVLDAFSEILMDAVIDRFKLFDDRPHTPRITVDKVVLCREKWRLPSADVPFAKGKDEARRFVLARRWQHELGLPDQIFVTPNKGAKPVYIDFASPTYVNLLAKFVRRAQTDGAVLTITEMLPDHDELWLRDRAGRAHTSELRFAAFDRTCSAKGQS
ncbi:lantibiotic dehydratase [Labedaea rhizosphaerae]|uniref:Lantibiotic biosynthesis dehydratase-like protein n=1 Tax=Labedaea rhizosphaerae TaxID=598644 RepID=A0A4R6RUX6_LABRH|nr:lantibiotic dehydratase [Labedaea rhizosphaerae]TDP89886.1 lantibiotic biosynthesis dehydratase-like protein [Labedaea rhizosphaerae]